MIDVNIHTTPDGKMLYATFDTRLNGNGRRAKHYICPNDKGFCHVTHFLIPKDEVSEYEIGWYVSERVFFGKMRLVELIEDHLPETWMAIGETVKMFCKDLTMWAK